MSQPKNNIKNPISMKKKIFKKITREKLKALYEEGTLTKEQFEKAKDKLLN